MKCFCIFAAALVSVATAELYYPIPNDQEYIYPPQWYVEQLQRHRRDVNFDPKTGDVTATRKLGDGNLFGKLGSTDAGLYGQGGYEGNVFNDDRGKLDARGYGTRTLGPYGDSTSFSGGATWSNDNARASVDLTRQLQGRSSVHAEGGGLWPVGKNADVSVQGTYDQTFGGRPDYGVLGKFNYRFP